MLMLMPCAAAVATCAIIATTPLSLSLPPPPLLLNVGVVCHLQVPETNSDTAASGEIDSASGTADPGRLASVH